MKFRSGLFFFFFEIESGATACPIWRGIMSISSVTRIFNLIVTLGFGISLVFFYESLRNAYVAPRLPGTESALIAMVRYPLRCQGGIILAFGIADVLQSFTASRTTLAALSVIATSISFASDYELWTSFSSTSFPPSEYLSFVYFQLCADGLATVVGLLTLFGALSFSPLKWFIVLMEGTFGFLLYFFWPQMMEASFGPSSAPHIVAALLPHADWIGIQWKLCGSAMMGMAVVMMSASLHAALSLSFFLSAYAHIAAYMYVNNNMMSSHPNAYLITAAISAIGFTLNALTLATKQNKTKTK